MSTSNVSVTVNPEITNVINLDAVQRLVDQLTLRDERNVEAFKQQAVLNLAAAAVGAESQAQTRAQLGQAVNIAVLVGGAIVLVLLIRK